MVQLLSPRHKLLFFSWIVVVLVVASFGVRGTWATYSSQEVVGKNTLHGGSIELSVSSIESETIESGYVHRFKVKNDGYNSLGYQMILKEEDDFCGSLQLTAEKEDIEVYSGELSSFSYSATEALDFDKNDSWKFPITLSEDVSAPENAESCGTTLRLEAWQDRFLSLGMGWYDEQEIIFPPMIFESADTEQAEVANQEIPSESSNAGLIEEGVLQDTTPESVTDSLPIIEADAKDLIEVIGATIQDSEALPVE